MRVLQQILLGFVFFQAAPQNVGVVTGVVRSSGGSPAIGVRVYASPVRDAAEANNVPVIESQTQTDASGRYRLETPPGRYHIATGSLSAPTYYPGTSDISAARVVSVSAGAVVEGVNFSSFVPATSNIGGIIGSTIALPPGSTGVLGGTLRFPDGSPAGGIVVLALPASAINSQQVVPVALPAASTPAPAALVSIILRRPVATTDNNGRYRIENLPPDTYYLVAGYAEFPTLYPGSPDPRGAKTVSTTPTTKLDNLDFQITAPPARTSVSGRVTTNSGHPVAGASVRLRAATLVPAAQTFGLPTLNAPRVISVDADGRYEVTGVTPGNYALDVLVPGIRGVSKDIVVLVGQPLRDVDLSVLTAVLSGQVLLDDGSPLPDPQLFSDAIVSTIDNPNLILSTILPLNATGSFARIVEAGEYRFYLRNLPEEYTIQSMRSGSVDLLREPLKIAGVETANVDIRVARRVEASAVNVSGVMLDAISGKPPVAERVTLCCHETGPADRLSTRLRADGSFEFQGVPPGKYTVGLQTQGQPTRHTVDSSTIEVRSEPQTGVKFATTAGFVQLGVRVTVEGRQGPPGVVRIAFLGVSGGSKIEVSAPTEGAAIATVPSGDVYLINVGAPAGYTVKSINGSSDVTNVRIQTVTQPSSQITIVLAPLP